MLAPYLQCRRPQLYIESWGWVGRGQGWAPFNKRLKGNLGTSSHDYLWKGGHASRRVMQPVIGTRSHNRNKKVELFAYTFEFVNGDLGHPSETNRICTTGWSPSPSRSLTWVGFFFLPFTFFATIAVNLLKNICFFFSFVCVHLF